MIESTFYLSDSKTLNKAMSLTGLALDELESAVGRFKKDHWRWPGELKGEVVIRLDGKILIRHHFSKKVLWRQ